MLPVRAWWVFERYGQPVRGQLRFDGAVDVAVDAARAEAVEDAVLLEHGGDGRLDAGEPQLDLHTLGEVEDLRELRGSLGIDQVDALEVEHNRVDRLVALRDERADPLLECVGGREEEATVEVSSPGFSLTSRNTSVPGSRPRTGMLGAVAT